MCRGPSSLSALWRVLAVCLVLGAAGAAAADVAAQAPAIAASQSAERTRIAAERADLLQRLVAEEQACQGRFVVTTCVEGVQAQRRQALEGLRDRELRLDEAERSRRADARRAAVQAKQEAAARRQRLPASPASSQASAPAGVRTRPPAAGATQPASVPASAAPRVLPRSRQAPSDPQAAAAAAAARAEAAAARVRAAQERRQKAQAAQLRVAQRLEDRLREGKPPQSLPSPGAVAELPAAATASSRAASAVGDAAAGPR